MGRCKDRDTWALLEELELDQHGFRLVCKLGRWGSTEKSDELGLQRPWKVFGYYS